MFSEKERAEGEGAAEVRRLVEGRETEADQGPQAEGEAGEGAAIHIV